jgi:hypothetical protein
MVQYWKHCADVAGWAARQFRSTPCFIVWWRRASGTNMLVVQMQHVIGNDASRITPMMCNFLNTQFIDQIA